MDLVAPSVVDVAITSTGPYTEGEVIELTVTFSEVVTLETGTGTPRLPLMVGDDTRDAEYTATAPAATAVFNYTVVAGDNDDDGVAVAADALTAGGGTIRDGAGNDAALAHAAIAADTAQRVDAVIPDLLSVAVNGDVVTLTYDEALDEGSVPLMGAYTLTSDVALTVNMVSISGDTVTLMLSGMVVSGNVVTLAYTAGINPVQDVVGNEAADFTGEMVTNDTPVVITGNFVGAVTERGASAPMQTDTVEGTLAAGGGFVAQDGTTATDLAGGLGIYGTFVLDANGGWVYTLDNASTVTNALAEGTTRIDVFTAVSASDDDVSQVVTITITGANDAPTAVIDEAPMLMVVAGDSVTLNSSGSADPDTGDSIVSYIWEVVVNGVPLLEPATLDEATLTFPVPQVVTEQTYTITLVVSDSEAASLPTTVTVTVSPDTAPVFDETIDDQSYTEGVGIDDLILPMAGGGNGTLTYTLTPALPNGLEFDDQALEISGRPELAQAATEYTYTVSDSDFNVEASDMDTITFMITINANPIGGVTEGAVTEDDPTANTATGTLTLPGSDFVAQTTATATVRAGGLGTYGRFELTAEGVWTYTLDNADSDTNALAVGAEAMDVFTAVSASDGGVLRDVIITITGANDAPTAVIDEAPMLMVVAGDDVTLNSSGSADPDTDDSIVSYTWEVVGDVVPPLMPDTLDEATLTFMAPQVETEQTYTITLVVNDGSVDSAADTVTITVTDDDAVVGDIVLSPTSLTVSETGSASYDVSLSAAPSGQVNVAIAGGAGSDGLTFDPAILTFDVGNSDVAQAVTVTATASTLPEDSSSLTLSILHTASGGGYDDVEGSLSLTVLEQPGLVRNFTATPARGGRAVLSWEAPENAVATAVTQYELQRRARSATDFVALETLAFGMTTTQFVLPRRSFVTSFEFRIRALAAGVVGEWVSTDPSPGALLSVTSLLEIEEGGTATYTVVLQTVPTDSVTVVISSNNDDVTATSLTFTVANWNIPQEVTVTAAPG